MKAPMILITCVLVVVGTACATVPAKMNKQIGKAEFRYAIKLGQEYVKEKPEGEHVIEVEHLMCLARFRLARKLDTPEAYEAFRRMEPGSKYDEELMANWARVEYETYTRKTDTLETYREFLNRFPTGPFANKARIRSARLAWRKADATGTRIVYRMFRTVYPASEYARTAYNKELALAWKEAEKKKSVEAFLQFAKEYAGSQTADLVYKIAHAMAWTKARRKDRVRWYSWFRGLFPDSPHYADAYGREVALAWVRADKEDNEATYRWYRLSYPDTPEADIAEQRELDWAYFNSPTKGEWPSATIHQVNDRDMDKVWLYVDVRSRAASFVAGLRPEQFTIYENGRRAETVDFLGMESKRPIDIVFMIDVSGSMSDEIAAVKQSAIKFAEELRFRQRDCAFGLVTFCDDVDKVYGGGRPTKSAKTFQRWVGSVKILNQGNENPVQAIWRASKYKFRKGTQKVLVLVTDEHPNTRHDRKSKMNVFDAAKLMLDQDITFYAIAPTVQDYQLMRQVAGGKVFDIHKVHQWGGFAGLMGYISSLLSTQYRVAFSSPRRIPHGGNRNVRVRVEHQSIWMTMGELAQDVVAFIPQEDQMCGLVALTREKGIFLSQDCGKKWKAIDNLEFDAPVKQAVGQWGKNKSLFVLLESGQLLAVKDAGSLVQKLNGGFTNPNSVAWSMGYPERLWVTTVKSVWLSEDSGATFKVMGGDIPVDDFVWAYAAPASEQICVMGSGGELYCREGSAGTWWRIRLTDKALAGGLPAGTRIFGCPWDSGMLFLRWGDSALYRSIDGGKSWRLMHFGKKSVRLGNLFFGSPANKLVCQMTAVGPYCSADRGLTWMKLAEGSVWDEQCLSSYLAADNRGNVFLYASGNGRFYRLFEVANREVVSGEVFFDSGDDNPKDELLPHLYKIGKGLARDPTIRAKIDGHTDSDGSDEFNMDLSKRRATNVRAHLLKAGARAWQIETAGYGEVQPLVPNTTATNKQKNRRVEILMIREVSSN